MSDDSAGISYWTVNTRMRREKGLCHDCPQMATPGRSRCEDCRAKHAQGVKERLIARNNRGLCKKCNEPLATTSLCRSCAKKSTADSAKRYWKTRTRQRIHSCYHCGQEGHMSKTCTRWLP